MGKYTFRHGIWITKMAVLSTKISARLIFQTSITNSVMRSSSSISSMRIRMHSCSVHVLSSSHVDITHSHTYTRATQGQGLRTSGQVEMAGTGDSSKINAIPDIKIDKPEISEVDREKAEALKDKANTYFKGKPSKLSFFP